MRILMRGLRGLLGTCGFLMITAVFVSCSDGFAQTEQPDDSAIKLASAAEVATALPSAAEVIEKHIMAMGGFELLSSLQSSHFVFKGKSSSGHDLESSYYQSRGRYYCHMRRNGLSITRGVWANGELNEKGLRVGFAWQSINGGPWTEKAGDELQEYLRRRTHVVASPFWQEEFKSIECVDKTEVRGIPAWKLLFVDGDGREIERYFEVETGYLLRRKTLEAFDGSSHEVTREYKGHEKIGEFVVAMRQSISYNDVVEDWRVDSFEYECELPEELYDVPNAIQSRIDKMESNELESEK